MTPEQQIHFPPVRVVLKNNESVMVRLLREDDADGLGDLYESVPLEDARFYLSPSRLNRTQASSETSQADSPFFVGMVLEAGDASVAGYAYYAWSEESSTVSRFGICIRRDYQGCGAGKVLMTHLLEIARRIGPPTMGLHVQKANQRAVDLYSKMGFEIIQEQIRAARDCFEAEPEYYMERRVR